MPCHVVGAVSARWLADAHSNGAAASRHSAEDVMTDKKRTDDLDLNEKGLLNRAKGAAEEAKGRARNAMGGLTGDGGQQLKGMGEELKGKSQQTLGKAQQKLDDVLDRNDRKAP
jgi:uncharacterized protein YjbJ (UPF0337 family)